MTAPPALLVAARDKYLASPQCADALAAGKLGTWQIPAQPWVFIGVDRRTGRPDAYGKDTAAVVFNLRSAAWTNGLTSARYPTLAGTVWAQGDPETGSAEWLVRDVAESIIGCFDDPAGEHAHQWSDDVYVIRCRWDGELSVSEILDMPGFMRADFAFKLGVL